MRKFFSAGKPKQGRACGFAKEEKKGGSFMKRILLIVAMLLIAVAPAMATITVNAKHIGIPVKAGVPCTTCEVNYVCDAGEKVRAFALEITLSGGYTITGIKDFNLGESNKVGYGIPSPARGYGIFPGKFRDVINAADPNFGADTNYNPIAPATDADATGTGIGTNKIIVELGSLYVGESNAPPSSGMLFRFDIAGPGTTPTNISIVANATRGGVVLEDGETVTATLNGHTGAGFPELFPCWQPYSTQYNEYMACFKPRCWAGATLVGDANWRTQCWGDADGKFEGPINKYRVYSSDYTKMVQAWGKKATALRSSMGTTGGLLCADFDHKYEGPINKYRVYSSDYAKLLAGWGKKETVLRVAPYGWCPQ